MKTNYKGFTITIEHDLDSNPREEFENLGLMVYRHRRYKLGDVKIGESKKGKPYFYDVDDFEKWMEKHAVVSLPLFLLDHSGLRISTEDFNDHWDSGQVGYIIATRESIKNDFEWKRLTAKRKKRIKKILKHEVKMFNSYLAGDARGRIGAHLAPPGNRHGRPDLGELGVEDQRADREPTGTAP